VYERKDAFYRKAKAAGLRSRAAFKLEDLDRRLFRDGDRVVDLGCWPGGWLQIASRRVGARGRVVGVDKKPLAPLALPNVTVLQADVAAEGTIDALRHALGAHADVLLSDLSPELSGIRDRDETRASELVRLALRVAERLLRPGGSMLVKVFMNSDYRSIVDEAKSRFADVTVTRSGSSRKGSAELYLIGKDFTPRDAATS
jgi:23S rRNA (uridine2552-2'-O)-methyltransferase